MSSANPTISSLLPAAETIAADTVALRRAIHRSPEIGLRLPVTQRTVLDALADLPLTISTGRELSSVVAVLKAGTGPGVLLRADMDALPLTEDTGLSFASANPGVMHACGHDTHVAMLLSAARLICERAEDLPGPVVFMFQPGEEGFHGARHMIDEGVLETAEIGRAFALHITSRLKSGVIRARPGPAMAAQDRLRVVVRGRGGHAAAPHQAVDPIPAAAAMIGALQTMITRRLSAVDPTVLTVGQLVAGTTCNIIPETAELEATMRTMSEEGRAVLHKEVHRVCEHVAAAYDCSAEIEIFDGYPVTVNDVDTAEHVLRLAEQVLGPGRSGVIPAPLMGAEDFSYIAARVPATMAYLGACPSDTSPDEAPSNHSNRVVFNESALPHGVAMHVAVALSGGESDSASG
jgi:hippurate hydrolase